MLRLTFGSRIKEWDELKCSSHSFRVYSLLAYFRYLSSQPKNSRFQTIEFWGLNT